MKTRALAAPSLADMSAETRDLHQAVNQNMRRRGRPYLRPDGESVNVDLFGSGPLVSWQERKGQATFLSRDCWSELPQIYARYGTEQTRMLLERVKSLESAAACVLTDSGMQAVAVLLDVLVEPGSHVIVARGVYNKTKSYLGWMSDRLGLEVSLVEDDQLYGWSSLVTERTRVVFVETYTNPLLRAADPERLIQMVRRGRHETGARLRLVIDDTIATPWGLAIPLLETGVDFVVASGTKALDGRDRNMWGYVASNHVDAMNGCMDLQAMRGGALDGHRAMSILSGLEDARNNFEKRCTTATKLARVLLDHPAVDNVYHPSLAGHADRSVIDEHYRMHGSLFSFRLRRADDERTRHFCDVLAMTEVPRYALSFDGLVTKINHHRTVSEYFTSPAEVARLGVDRLVRVGVGLEAPEDLARCFHWALECYDSVSPAEVRAWQKGRARDLLSPQREDRDA